MAITSTDADERVAPRRTMKRRVMLAAVAATSALALSACWGPSQHQGLDHVNWSRGTNGLHAVNGDSALMAKAQRWSEHMARTGRLEHSGGGSNLSTSGIHNWCGVAENVGYGGSPAEVHQSFMRSGSHRANVLGRFDRLGTGVVRKGSIYWVTEIYVRSC